MGRKEQKYTLDERAIMLKTAGQVAEGLLDAVLRAGGWAHHARVMAEDAGTLGELMGPELLDIQERFQALHLVMLVAGGYCATDRCGKRLTDPARSASGARHCRDCRVGWVLEQGDGVVRAVPQPWPEGSTP